MSLVVDCSVALAWLLPDEESSEAMAVLEAILTEGGMAPRLWAYEIQNGLLVALRRKRIDDAFVADAIATLRALPIILFDPPYLGRELPIARERGLTAYDAAYIGTARDADAPLATLDRRLADAARSCGVALWQDP